MGGRRRRRLPAASLRRWTALGLLLIAFVGTRAVGAWLADRPDRYRSGPVTVSGDVDLYERWGTEVARNGRTPYGDVKIEYPPGSLPFMLAPLAGSDGQAYRPRFIGLMVAIDVAGLAGLLVLARRTGSLLGPWLWTVLVPLLGPISYLRLDLVPAVATIWALERAFAGSWLGAGGFLGFGAVAKVYPGLLLPLLVAGRWRTRAVVGAAVVLSAGLLPFAGSLPQLWDSVVGYHGTRGLQVESSWGAALLAAAHLDGAAQVVFDHGAFHVQGPGASTLKTLSLALSLAALGAGVAVARARVDRESPGQIAAAMLGTLALLLAMGTVFSPQFMLWLSALGAVAACLTGRALRLPLALLCVASALSQAVYPFHYAGLLANHAGPLGLLVVRNCLVGGVGVLVLARLWTGRVGRA